MESEVELIARCRLGHSDAWDELFNRFYPATGRFLYQLSPAFTPEDVEELCQETFLAVIRNLGAFEGGSSFQTWLFRIAINKGRDYLAKQQAGKRGGGKAPLSLNVEHPETGLRIDPPSEAPGPDRVLSTREQGFLLREALDQLGDPCREIIELKYFGDLSYDQIAGELNLNPKTVSSRLSKCLDKLEEIARPLLQPEKLQENAV